MKKPMSNLYYQPRLPNLFAKLVDPEPSAKKYQLQPLAEAAKISWPLTAALPRGNMWSYSGAISLRCATWTKSGGFSDKTWRTWPRCTEVCNVGVVVHLPTWQKAPVTPKKIGRETNPQGARRVASHAAGSSNGKHHLPSIPSVNCLIVVPLYQSQDYHGSKHLPLFS